MRLQCVLGHHWSPWRHDGMFIDSFDAQTRYCQRPRCHKRQYSDPLFPGVYHLSRAPQPTTEDAR